MIREGVQTHTHKFSNTSSTRVRAALPSAQFPPMSLLSSYPVVTPVSINWSILSHCWPHTLFASRPRTSNAAIEKGDESTKVINKSQNMNLLYINWGAIGWANILRSLSILANHVQYLGSWNILCSGFSTGRIFNIWKYTRMIPETRFEYSSVVSKSSPRTLFRYPTALEYSARSVHGRLSKSWFPMNSGIGHPPQRCTSLAKKIEGKCSRVSKKVKVTWASGIALRFSAVTSVSAWRRMHLASE